MFIAHESVNSNSLPKERHVDYACTSHSYGASGVMSGEAINMLLLRSKFGEPNSTTVDTVLSQTLAERIPKLKLGELERKSLKLSSHSIEPCRSPKRTFFKRRLTRCIVHLAAQQFRRTCPTARSAAQS